MKDYKANIITALIFLLLIGSGFLAIEIRDKRAEEKARIEKQEEEEREKRLTEKAEANRNVVLEEIEIYIEELESDEKHEDKIIEDMYGYHIEHIEYLKLIKDIISEAKIYYVEEEKRYFPTAYMGLDLGNIGMTYYIDGSFYIRSSKNYLIDGFSKDFDKLMDEIQLESK